VSGTSLEPAVADTLLACKGRGAGTGLPTVIDLVSLPPCAGTPGERFRCAERFTSLVQNQSR
jgi:hypothetical protein